MTEPGLFELLWAFGWISVACFVSGKILSGEDRSLRARWAGAFATSLVFTPIALVMVLRHFDF